MPPIVIMGDGPDAAKWRDFIANEGLKNVQMVGYMTGEELWRGLRHALG